MRWAGLITVMLIGLAGMVGMITAPVGAASVALEPAFGGLAFERPVGLYPVPGFEGRWFLLEKGGRVIAIRESGGAAETEVVLDIRDRVDAGPNEAGLLGLAFHPDYPENGKVFISYTRDGNPLVSYISRFESDAGGPIRADSEQTVLTIDQPFGNHNGGNVAFGPDGYLYAGFGDGGAGGDPHENGQDTHTLLGAMLRIDVVNASPYGIPPDNPFADGEGGRPELYAWGLRNPWRWSFDPATRRLWAGDVGQDHWEEVNIVIKGGNYGWNIREGSHCFEGDVCPSQGLIPPVTEYSHGEGCSVTGGYVYRGEAIGGLEGQYLFADFCSGTVWSLRQVTEDSWNRTVLLNSGLAVSSFARGPDGEVYLLDYGAGGIHKLVPG